MDRLPWARWHWLIVIGLGTVWILDGLEVTIVGNLSEVLKPDDGLNLSSSDIGLAGALLTVPLTDPNVIDRGIGWRFTFGLGAILGLGVLWVRRNVPESPRWLFIHGREEEGERIVAEIEETIEREDQLTLEPVDETLTIRQRRTIPFRTIAHTVFALDPKRTVLCLSLFAGQEFLYNAFFFTYGDTLSTFLGVKQTGWYIAAFALSNFVGALVLGPLFDTVGRVRMISGTYILFGVLLAIAGMSLGHLTAMTLTIFGAGIFFFASAGVVAIFLGVKAEGETLENIAKPLTAEKE